MRRALVLSCLRTSAAMLSVAATSCSDDLGRRVEVSEQDNGYLLRMRIQPVEGFCYAPSMLRLNGSLSLKGFEQRNIWKVGRIGINQVEGLSKHLAADRRKIGREIRLVVEGDHINERPFSIQFIVFPCNASRNPSQLEHQEVGVVSLVADIGPYNYPRDDSPDLTDGEWMTNISTGSP